jgi:uncharacterized membrane protein (TIGR02234 family)
VTRARLTFAAALAADLLGAAGVLLFAGRAWQHVTVSRARPLPDAVTDLTGRDLHPASTAFALIALAGLVAIAATRGWARRVVGLALVAAGAVVAWYAIDGAGAVSATQARAALKSGVGVDSSSVVHISLTSTWPVLTALSAALIVLGGVLTVAYAGRWSALAGRYEAPTAAAQAERGRQTSSDIALWSALDRGDDPTARTES